MQEISSKLRYVDCTNIRRWSPLKKRKVIIVGESNICRSFMAETVLRGILQKRDIKDIEVISRGLVVLFAEPVDPTALELLLTRGYQISGFNSVQLTEEDLQSADLVLCMKSSQVEQIRDHFETPVTCMYLGTLIDQQEAIPDMSEDKESYEKGLSVIEPMMEAVADRLIGELLS